MFEIDTKIIDYKKAREHFKLNASKLKPYFKVDYLPIHFDCSKPKRKRGKHIKIIDLVYLEKKKTKEK